jgi:hypothetical protein
MCYSFIDVHHFVGEAATNHRVFCADMAALFAIEISQSEMGENFLYGQ